MATTTAPAPRTGSLLPALLPAGARSAVRGAARVVVATVGAVLAGLVVALPAAHLPLTALSAGPQTVLVSSVDHRLAGAATSLVPGVRSAAHAVALPVVVATPAVAQVLAAPAAPAAALGTDLAPGAPWVLLAAVLVGLSRPLGRRRAPARPPHLGPAPLRGPPGGLAPAP